MSSDTISAQRTSRKRSPFKDIEATFEIAEGIYVIGSLETGVTVYSQQVRAHNLIWALATVGRIDSNAKTRIAIVGGGIAGLTASACALSLFPGAHISVFEKRWDLCPLQQGCDNRWLHPKIYDWPRSGSRAPSASLPILNWSEGRASDVARQIIRGFNLYAEPNTDRLDLYIGVKHLKIDSSKRQIEWIATKAKMKHAFLHLAAAEGVRTTFDIIIIAGGFGLEKCPERWKKSSYWRNEQIGQPVLNGVRKPYVISGYGDGAIVDLCRLVVSRFRQDSILYDVFGSRNIESVEQKIRHLQTQRRQEASNQFEALSEILSLVPQRENIRPRLRSDTAVVMHLTGPDSANKSFEDVFSQKASFLNKFLFRMLYSAGAFSISFDTLEETVQEYGVPDDGVICRYGTNPMGHLTQLFNDPLNLTERLESMKSAQLQTPEPCWVPGSFPLAD